MKLLLDTHVFISVVVPAYNAADTLAGCLRALGLQTLPPEQYEVIVVDDGSTDGTAEVARAFPVRLCSIAHAGPAVARNAGAALARGDLLVFTDADCEPAPDFLEQITAPLANPAVAAVKGVYRTRQRGLLARFIQVEFEQRYDRMLRQETIDFVDTYAAAYRRAVFERYGGFDERFRDRPTVEDVELSFRLAAGGERMVFAPRAVVYHRHAGSLPAYLRKKLRYGIWRVQIYRRYPGKLVRDSYTPPEMPAQVVLAGLIMAFVLGAAVADLARPIAPLALLFALTTLPYCRQAWGRDRSVLPVAPALLFLRSLAQATGLLIGIISLPWLARRPTALTPPCGHPSPAERERGRG